MADKKTGGDVSEIEEMLSGMDEVFDALPEETDEDPILNTEERIEHEEYVKKVLSDDEPEEKNGRIKINFARKKTRKEQELSNVIANAIRYTPDVKKGLTLNQVTGRKEQGLVNVTNESNAKTYRSIFFQNLVTFFNILCVVVAIALIAVRSYSNLMFLFMMVINTSIGIFQEIRAKKKIEKMSLLSSAAAVVIREGDRVTIPVNEVVLDDILYLENGKQITSDSIVLKGEIEVNEALLTGESVAVKKREGDTLYGGSFVSSGTCYARVEKVGNANYISKLSSFAKKYKRAHSEILSSLKMIIAVIGILIVPIAALLAFVNYSAAVNNPEIISPIVTTVTNTAGAIIGMVPAGMFLLTSVALMTSVITLGNKQVLVQDLYCIEMLARVDVLCLDKTGTITDGTMQVQEVIELNGEGEHSIKEIIGSMLTATEDNNSTSIALAQEFGYSNGLTPKVIMPFSSQRKLSAVTFSNGITYVLGAPEFVLRGMGAKMEKIISDKAKEGLRVIALAQSTGEIKNDKLPNARKALALIAIEDHIREDAFDTLKWFRENGVAVKVISGDNPVTVSEVAQRVGVENAHRYVSLDGKTDNEVVELAHKFTVFGRVTPEQKRILIRSFKAKGHTVAMTGDGVNDILALKEADCSVAIASGSEAARNVSHMVLQDNNFANMPSVVHEGRRVVNNIQKSSSLFLMKTLFSVFTAVLTIILNLGYSNKIQYPFEPKHLLLLEMFVIGLPSFVLAFQANKNRIEGRFLGNIIRRAFPAGITLILAYLALFIFSERTGIDQGSTAMTTMAVLILTFGGLMMLIKMCIPFDIFKASLCIFSGLLCIGALFLLPESLFGTDMSVLEPLHSMFVIVVVLASYFVVSMLTLLFKMIKINPVKTEKKSAREMGQ